MIMYPVTRVLGHVGSNLSCDDERKWMMAIPEETQRAIKKAVNAVGMNAIWHGDAQRELGEMAGSPVTIGEYEASLAEWQMLKDHAASKERALTDSVNALLVMLRDAGVIL